jgi:hypothetical protein
LVLIVPGNKPLDDLEEAAGREERVRETAAGIGVELGGGIGQLSLQREQPADGDPGHRHLHHRHLPRDVAVDVPQHVSKGLSDPGNADRGRGASALKDGGRLVYTLCGMSKEDADAFGLDPSERGDFVRVDHGKVNLTSRADARTKWFRFVGVKLGNTWDPRYPKGDTVGTLEPWNPPDAKPTTSLRSVRPSSPLQRLTPRGDARSR